MTSTKMAEPTELENLTSEVRTLAAQVDTMVLQSLQLLTGQVGNVTERADAMVQNVAHITEQNMLLYKSVERLLAAVDIIGQQVQRLTDEATETKQQFDKVMAGPVGKMLSGMINPLGRKR